MREDKGDLFSYPADAICITTNGQLKKDGNAVMGAGVALQARKKWPDLPEILGKSLKAGGNVVSAVAMANPEGGHDIVVFFPTKHAWWEPSDMILIKRSADQLVELADHYPGWKTIALPRPGCENGRLEWTDVKELIEPILDDRFVVLEYTQKLEAP